MKRTLTILMGTSLLLGQPLWAQSAKKDRARSEAAAATATVTGEQSSRAARAATQDVRRTTAPATTTRTDLVRSNTAPASTSSRTAIRSTSGSRDYVQSDRRYDNDRWDRNDRDRWDDENRRSGSSSRYRYSHPPSYVYRGWDRGRSYWWNNHRWHWHGGTWVIIDASPGYYTDYAVSGRSVVAQVQRELQREGYNPGPADGVAGTKTRRAIAAFQRNNGLPVTGQINSSLLRALDIA